MEKINARITELKAWISGERKKLSHANPESAGELTPDFGEIWKAEEELKELQRRKITLERGSIGAD